MLVGALKDIMEKDYTYGREKESEILIKMNSFFNDSITQTAERFDTKDYLGEKYKYELKSRKNKYESFPTTIIPCDKVKEGTNYVFLFNFTNGLYHIYYDPELFKTFKTDTFKRTDGSQNNKNKLYWYIPIENLIQII
jgi:hypothetical protein|nr:MAG: hypothetical protein [Lake Baikal virophage 13]